MGRILNPQLESSPLTALSAEVSTTSSAGNSFHAVEGGTPDFWDQYFRFQDLADKVAEHDAHVSVDIVNRATGESFHFDNIVLKSSDETAVN